MSSKLVVCFMLPGDLILHGLEIMLKVYLHFFYLCNARKLFNPIKTLNTFPVDNFCMGESNSNQHSIFAFYNFITGKCYVP